MTNVTLQVLEGVDRGRVFRNLPVPVTIGREEGNLLRLNDERVSRFHAKIQQDDGDTILTDLDSTNGTRVNGKAVQVCRLRLGDCICVGRSLLLFGSHEEIASRMKTMLKPSAIFSSPETATVRSFPSDVFSDFNVNPDDQIVQVNNELFIGTRPLPPLPRKLTPAQVARLADVFDFLHTGLSCATENVHANSEGTEIKLTYAEWQKILAVQMLLARYHRSISEPEEMEEER